MQNVGTAAGSRSNVHCKDNRHSISKGVAPNRYPAIMAERYICISKLGHHSVFKIRSETCRTEAQFCQNLYMIKKKKEGKPAGPTQILPVNVRGPALILKTDH